MIWPNVDVDGIKALKNKKTTREGFIIYGRQVSWKRMDIAIDAAIKTKENLTVIGSGPEHDQLVRRAAGAKNITFLPKYNGISEIVQYIRASKAYIFPSLEPFGIAAVESLAAGTPVIALHKGGALDIVNKDNGVFFEEQTVESLCAAIKEFNSRVFTESKVTQSAEKFSEAQFRQQLQTLINKHVNEKTS